MRTRIIYSGSLLLAAGLICTVALSIAGWPKQAVTAYNPNNLIRLHVIANSNSSADQELKLKVRDAILKATTPMLSQNVDSSSAARSITGNLNYIEAVARSCIAKEGYAYPVRAEYGWHNFPDRTYDDVVVHQGRYRALRVIIGKGVGHNWWCVLFPPMCFSDVQRSVKPVPVETAKVKIKFRLVEKIQQLGKEKVAKSD